MKVWEWAGSNSRPLDLQSDMYLQPDMLPTVLMKGRNIFNEYIIWDFLFNSLPDNSKFCCLLIIFANSLDPDQAWQLAINFACWLIFHAFVVISWFADLYSNLTF